MSVILNDGFDEYVLLPKIFSKVDFYYQIPDVVMDQDGDLQLNSTGDLDLDEEGHRAFFSDVIKRVLTEQHGMALHPEYGAGLDSLMGEPINHEMSEKVKALIYRGLTDHERVQGIDILMETARLDESTIAVILVVDTKMKRFSFPLILANIDSSRIQLEG